MRRLGIPLPLFIVLIVAGLYLERLTWKQAGVFALIAIGAAVLIGTLGLPFVLFHSFLAVLDIALLIFVVYRGAF